MDDEALVAKFMEATGCGREDAFDRLASCGGHLGRAINSFFSIDAGPSSGRSRSRPPRPSSSSSSDAARAPKVPAQRIMVSRWDSDTKPIVVGRSKSSRRRERRRRNRSRGGIGTASANASSGGDRAAADGNRGRRRRFREFRQDTFSDAEEDEEEKETNNSRSRRRLNPSKELITPKVEKKKAAADDDSSRHLLSFRDEDVVNVSSDDEDNMLEELDEAPRRPPPARNRTFEELFKVPRGLTFEGGFHDAKVHAARRQRWLLVNVQSSDDRPLPSLHQNRDVWGNDLVAQCVRDRFVLWQADTDDGGQGENEAKKLLGYYGIQHDQLPVVVVVDPVTGQAMDVLHGSAACELNDFLARLGPHTETKPVIPVVAAKKATTNASSAGGQLSSARPATTSTTTSAPTSSERAAVSRQQQAPTTATTTVMRKQPDAVVPAVAPTCQTRQEQAVTTTTTTVTPEPAVAPCTGQCQPQPESVEEKLCTVRVRLADGRVVTKDFGSQCTVAALFEYCRSMLDAGGAPAEKPFRLVRFVGRATEEIADQNASFESLGLHLTTVSVHLG